MAETPLEIQAPLLRVLEENTFVPVGGILACFYLMLGLPKDTWARLIIWMALGLLIYFLYGKKHSKVQMRG